MSDEHNKAVFDCKMDTLKHINNVEKFINLTIEELSTRAVKHDQSKLDNPELAIFVEYTPKLAKSTYGSEEYNQFLKEMKVALDHHYSVNRHHPEYFKDNFEYYCSGCGEVFEGESATEEYMNSHVKCERLSGSPKPEILKRPTLKGMTLVDLVEMICDWKAASMRHNDGDVAKSIEINQKRFGYSDELKGILLNTVKLFEG